MCVLVYLFSSKLSNVILWPRPPPLFSIAERMAVGYNSNDGSVATLYSLGWDSPSGQMYSNIDDMNKVLGCVMLLNPHVHACVMCRVDFICMVIRDCCLKHQLFDCHFLPLRCCNSLTA